MTVITDEAVEAAQERAELTAGLRALAAFIDTHEGSPIPEVYAPFPITGERGEQLTRLDEIAELLGVPVVQDETGTLSATRDFGRGVRAEGLVFPEGCSPAEISARVAGTVEAAQAALDAIEAANAEGGRLLAGPESGDE